MENRVKTKINSCTSNSIREIRSKKRRKISSHAARTNENPTFSYSSLLFHPISTQHGGGIMFPLQVIFFHSLSVFRSDPLVNDCKTNKHIVPRAAFHNIFDLSNKKTCVYIGACYLHSFNI